MVPVMIDDIRFGQGRPLQEQLYRQLADRVLSGRYQPGQKLPSSRQMSADLGVSRNTVNAVYDQLKAEGFLQSRAGLGVFVHENIHSVVGTDEGGRVVGRAAPAPLPPLPKMPAPT